MNFNSLYNKLEIIEEARAGRFENLFQTGYLKKAMMDKGVGVPRPLVFQFIMDFLESKGLVPEGTAFKGSRYAAEAGEFIKKLVDEGMIKDEIADEFKEYTKNNLGDFIGRKFQTTKHRTGEFAKKQQMEGGEERGKAAGELRKVKTAEELAAEREAKKEAERARAEDISPLSTIEANTTLIEIVGEEGIEIDNEKVKKFFTAANKGGEFSVDQEAPNMIDIEFTENDPIAKVVKKIGSNKVEASIKASLAKMLGLSIDEFSVVVHEPTTIEFPQDEPKRRTFAQRSGVDTEGYGMGTIAGDDSERRLANPFEDEEEPVTENAKPKVQFISNKDRFQPKTFWQKVAQQEMFYR
jgi:hypothetical protein